MCRPITNLNQKAIAAFMGDQSITSYTPLSFCSINTPDQRNPLPECPLKAFALRMYPTTVRGSRCPLWSMILARSAPRSAAVVM